ncbi:ACT domain-containing protein ACR9-like [Impatiens glandulifera]|uniref:ACT domain-containing protein ACR9-like n=1 Tax=Impatiens glandulifera TaxID=253017 RepID=UPI001FB08B3A|nr:ACT domain-containing protein ACR9-like [Impatiens glandulifera]
MVLPSEDDAVSIQKGKNPGEPHIITVNCPDKTGLSCDICWTILDFGLCITKGDVSTDGRWCYIVLWVIPHASTGIVRWSDLKNRLVMVCPTCSTSFYLNQPYPCPKASQVYLITFCCLDRKGLLHDVTQVLCELQLTIQRVKVTTTPDGRVLDLFFVTDNLDLLDTKQRKDETCEQLYCVLGDSCVSCELKLAGNQNSASSLSPGVAEELFRCELSSSESEQNCANKLSPDMTKLKNISVITDNSLSPSHTLLSIQCFDHKGLLYDILRTLKDCNVQVSYGRFCPVKKGARDLDLFIQQKNGDKIVDPEKQNTLCKALKNEMLHPLRVITVNRGPDTELLVANPVELSGKGRPRVFYDVTFALKCLEMCVFSAEIGRHSDADREWEVYRFLLDENCKFQLSNVRVRNHIVDRVRRTLMGW